MIASHRFFCLILFAATSSLHAQSDTLVLNDGRVLVGSYKLAKYQTVIESQTNSQETYIAKNVKSFSTLDRHFRVADINIKGESLFFLVERLVNSKVDLYEAGFPSGYFNANSVAQSFFYFEKDGVLTYVNQANLEAFYTTYFGKYYDGIPNKEFLYNKDSITKMLNAYNKLLSPDAPQQAIEPALSGWEVSVFGGFANLRHYPLIVEFNQGQFDDDASHLGLGFDFVIRNKIKVGIEINNAHHDLAFPVLARSGTNGPILLKAKFKTFGVNLTGSYIFRLKKLSIEPVFSAGLGKIYGYSESPLKPGIYVNFAPSFSKVFYFEAPYYNLNGSVKISYHIGSHMAIFAKSGFDIMLAKSLITSNVLAIENNHNIDGLQFVGGIAYKIKTRK